MTMGAIFFQNSLLKWFFEVTSRMEHTFFGNDAVLTFPTDPMHQLLIHGFGAGVIILGATLVYSYKQPERFLPFIFFDSLGRLLYGATMVYFVFTYDLARMVLVFGLIELSFAISYLYASWYLNQRQHGARS